MIDGMRAFDRLRTGRDGFGIVGCWFFWRKYQAMGSDLVINLGAV